MSKRISPARHRATPEKSATLGAMAQVIGRSGRQAAVIAAASGMVLAVPPAANAAPVQTDRETSTLPATNFKLERASRNADVISAEPGALNLNRADLESQYNEPESEPEPAPEPAPEPEPESETETEPAEEADLTPVTQETASETSAETQD